MTCREYAKQAGFTVVGKLRRVPVAEHNKDIIAAVYLDENENEYWTTKAGCWCIVTADGGVL